MADSDEEGTNGRDDGAGGPDLTSFLFGNIEGEAGGAAAGGVPGRVHQEAAQRPRESSDWHQPQKYREVREVSIEAEEASKEIEEEDFDEKAADAKDYSDIKEMMDDDSSDEDRIPC